MSRVWDGLRSEAAVCGRRADLSILRERCRSRMIATGNQIVVRRAARGIGPASVFGLLAWALVLGGLVGCSQSEEGLSNPGYSQVPLQTMVAVAPALNFSGSPAFDPVKVADLMASELAGIPGVGVIGVSRVLAVMRDQGVEQVQSPNHAIAICERLGADAILVFAVTEYDAYTPVVGLAAQVYGKRESLDGFDPVATSRMARPFAVEGSSQSGRPWAQSQRRFHGEQEETRQAVRGYAKSRQEGGSPFGWRKYVASQEWFLRFCCHMVASDLLNQTGASWHWARMVKDEVGDQESGT